MGTSQTSLDRTLRAALADGVASLEGDTIALLHGFVRDLAHQRGLDDLLSAALRVAAQLTAAQHATALLLDTTGEQICYRVALDKGNLAPLELVAKPMMRQGLAGWVAREGQAALVIDTEQDVRWLPGPGLGDLRSAMVAPLLVGGRALGMITLAHETPGHFGVSQLHALELLCAYVALAVDHALRTDAPAAARDQAAEAALSEPALERAPPLAGESALCQAVVLSAELRGLGSSFAGLAPALLFGAVLNRYFLTMDEIVRQHMGRIDSIAGDALLAIFCRSGQASSDALQAAFAMRAAAQELAADWRAQFGMAAGSLDIGIAYGQVAIGPFGIAPGPRRAAGRLLGVATRLRELARGGEVLTSDELVAQLDVAAFAVEALRPLQFYDAPQRIFRVDAR